MIERLPPDQEIQRLKKLNSRLDEQVKLLVQTEQRLHRSQWDRDQEFRRVRGLADFALEYSSVEDAGRIVNGAVHHLMNSFDIDYALCMYCGICVEVCPFDALFWSPDYEYSEYKISEMLHDKDRLTDWLETVPDPPALEK